MKCSLILALSFLGMAAQGSPVQAQEKEAEPEEFLLLQSIGQGEQMRNRTLWVKTSPKGAEVLGEFDHPLMAAGKTLYALQLETAHYQTYDREDLSSGSDEDGKPAKPITLKDHSYQRAFLKDVTAKNAAIWSSPVARFNTEPDAAPDDRCGEYLPQTTVSGFAGPYLSLELCEYADYCGVHGSVICRGVFFNLESGKAIELNDIKQFTMPTPNEQKSLKWTSNAEPLTEGEKDTPEIWRSQYGANGLEVSLLLSHSTDYAESGLEWSSYTSSAVFPQKQIPKDLAPYKDLPKALAQFASSEQTKLIGFSKIQKSEAVDRYLSAHAKPAKPVK